jgi:hypothetical protein
MEAAKATGAAVTDFVEPVAEIDDTTDEEVA